MSEIMKEIGEIAKELIQHSGLSYTNPYHIPAISTCLEIAHKVWESRQTKPNNKIKSEEK